MNAADTRSRSRFLLSAFLLALFAGLGFSNLVRASTNDPYGLWAFVLSTKRSSGGFVLSGQGTFCVSGGLGMLIVDPGAYYEFANGVFSWKSPHAGWKKKGKFFFSYDIGGNTGEAVASLWRSYERGRTSSGKPILVEEIVFDFQDDSDPDPEDQLHTGRIVARRVAKECS